MTVLKSIGGWAWAIILAVAGVALAIFGLSSWWQGRRRGSALTETAAELATEHVDLAEERAKRDELEATDKATDVVEAELGRINEEIERDTNNSSLADYLRSRGAGSD